MITAIKKSDIEITGRTIYMEIFGSNRVTYRVTAGQIDFYGKKINTYGIEAIDHKTGENEKIPDFSDNVEDAVVFAEQLISSKTKPKQIYSKALGFLKTLITA